MVSEDSNTSEVSLPETLVITREDIEAERNSRGIVHRILTSYRDYEGYLKGAVIPALGGGLLLGLLLSSAGATVAWTGGVLGAVAILGLSVLAGHKGWIKRGIADSAARIEPGVEPIAPPVVMPPIIIRPEEIPAEPDSEEGAVPGITIEPDELKSETAVAEAETICPYCGEALGARPVHVCPHCKTPHHLECWRANRGCTTLGCRSAPARN